MMSPLYRRGPISTQTEEDHPMTTIEKLRTLARELAGEAWDYERRQLDAQAYVRRKAARAVMKQADTILREDDCFEDPLAGCD